RLAVEVGVESDRRVEASLCAKPLRLADSIWRDRVVLAQHAYWHARRRAEQSPGTAVPVRDVRRIDASLTIDDSATTQMSMAEMPSTSLVLVSEGTDMEVQALLFQCATMLPAVPEPAVQTSPARETWILFRM